MENSLAIGILAAMYFLGGGDSDTALFFAELLLLLSITKKSEDE